MPSSTKVWKIEHLAARSELAGTLNRAQISETRRGKGKGFDFGPAQPTSGLGGPLQGASAVHLSNVAKASLDDEALWAVSSFNSYSL